MWHRQARKPKSWGTTYGSHRLPRCRGYRQRGQLRALPAEDHARRPGRPGDRSAGDPARQGRRQGGTSLPLRPLRGQRLRIRHEHRARRARGRGHHPAGVHEAHHRPAAVRAARGAVLGLDPPGRAQRRGRPPALAPAAADRGPAPDERRAATRPRRSTGARCARRSASCPTTSARSSSCATSSACRRPRSRPRWARRRAPSTACTTARGAPCAARSPSASARRRRSAARGAGGRRRRSRPFCAHERARPDSDHRRRRPARLRSRAGARRARPGVVALARGPRHHRRRRGRRRDVGDRADRRLQLRRVPQRRRVRGHRGPRVRGQRAAPSSASRSGAPSRARASST